jgi:hypothetical protein
MNPPARRRAVAYGDPATGLPPVGLPPTLGPTVADLAVSMAGQLNSLAKTVMPDPSRIKRALQLLHRDTPPAVRMTLRFDGAVARQFYFLVKEEVRVITCPTQATDSSNKAICLANLGDQLDDYRHVCFSPKEFGSYFITLVPKGTVTKYGLPTSESNPAILAPPGGGQPGDERLHWHTILEPSVDIPCFGAFPMACPVLPGDPAFDALNVRDDLDPGKAKRMAAFFRFSQNGTPALSQANATPPPLRQTMA